MIDAISIIERERVRAVLGSLILYYAGDAVRLRNVKTADGEPVYGVLVRDVSHLKDAEFRLEGGEFEGMTMALHWDEYDFVMMQGVHTPAPERPVRSNP